MDLKLLMLSGIAPVSLLDARFKFLREDRNPMVSGIVPLIKLAVITMCVKLWKLLIEDGNVPYS